MTEQAAPTTFRTSTAATVRPGRAANAALWVGQILLALTFLSASYPKVTLDPMAVQGFTEIGFSATGTFVIGLLEIAGAIGMLVPRVTGIAAIGALCLMIGAVLVTVTTMGVAMAALPAVTGVVAALIALGRRHSTAALIRLVRPTAAR